MFSFTPLGDAKKTEKRLKKLKSEFMEDWWPKGTIISNDKANRYGELLELMSRTRFKCKYCGAIDMEIVSSVSFSETIESIKDYIFSRKVWSDRIPDWLKARILLYPSDEKGRDFNRVKTKSWREKHKVRCIKCGKVYYDRKKISENYLQ
jgi:hypothetical protein